MIIYKTEIVEREVKTIAGISCDVCKRNIPLDDIMEIQEMVHIEFIGGYGSVFGDGDQVTLDMCQHCFKEKLGGFVTTFYVGD